MRARFAFAELFQPAAAIALLIGATAVQVLPALPPVWCDVALAVAGLALLPWRARWLGFLLLGAAWTLLRADIALSHRLAPALEGADLVVTGSIRGLPRVQDDGTRFEFDVRDGGATKLAYDPAGVRCTITARL